MSLFFSIFDLIESISTCQLVQVGLAPAPPYPSELPEVSTPSNHCLFNFESISHVFVSQAPAVPTLPLEPGLHVPPLVGSVHKVKTDFSHPPYH